MKTFLKFDSLNPFDLVKIFIVANDRLYSILFSLITAMCRASLGLRSYFSKKSKAIRGAVDETETTSRLGIK